MRHKKNRLITKLLVFAIILMPLQVVPVSITDEIQAGMETMAMHKMAADAAGCAKNEDACCCVIDMSCVCTGSGLILGLIPTSLMVGLLSVASSSVAPDSPIYGVHIGTLKKPPRLKLV